MTHTIKYLDYLYYLLRHSVSYIGDIFIYPLLSIFNGMGIYYIMSGEITSGEITSGEITSGEIT